MTTQPLQFDYNSLCDSCYTKAEQGCHLCDGCAEKVRTWLRDFRAFHAGMEGKKAKHDQN